VVIVLGLRERGDRVEEAFLVRVKAAGTQLRPQPAQRLLAIRPRLGRRRDVRPVLRLDQADLLATA